MGTLMEKICCINPNDIFDNENFRNTLEKDSNNQATLCNKENKAIPESDISNLDLD